MAGLLPSRDMLSPVEQIFIELDGQYMIMPSIRPSRPAQVSSMPTKTPPVPG